MTTNQLLDEGIIKRVMLFDSWSRDQSAPPADDGGVKRLIRYQLDAQPDVSLSFFFRGYPIDAASGAEFVALLQKPPHLLAEEETQPIDEILREQSEPKWFELRSVRTELLRDRTVLVTEGQWKSTGLLNLAIFINADAEGRIVQEIHYLAPEADYQARMGEAVACLTSIDWKTFGDNP